ncbi:hypothetical protein K2P96_00270 [Patescibacteria group bacterium]|nr:hypothetical protein [Patescibacteria group bacterium]
MPMAFYILLHMFVILPVLILVEGWDMLKKGLTDRNWWWRVPYVLLVLLSILFIVLLLKGYR